MEQLMSITQEETENLRQREVAGELWGFRGQGFQGDHSSVAAQGPECPLWRRAAKSVMSPGLRRAWIQVSRFLSIGWGNYTGKTQDFQEDPQESGMGVSESGCSGPVTGPSPGLLD